MPRAKKPMSPIDQLRARVAEWLDGLDPETPIGATVYFMVDSRHEQTFVRHGRALTEATRKLPGLDWFSFDKHAPMPGETWHEPAYGIMEHWQTVRDFKPQWSSEHLARFQHAIGPWVVDAPDLMFFYGAGEGGRQVRVLPTGQAKCWDSEGKVVTCKGSGQDGAFEPGDKPPKPRFTDHGNGTVTDELTGVVWLRDADAFGEVPWMEALATAGRVGDGQAGLSDGSRPGDWRLPNVNELESLLDLSNDSGPALPAGHPFENLEAANYWSSSSVAAFPALAWYVAMAVGPPVFDLKFNPMRMWPVRGTSHRVPQTGQTQCWDPMGQPIPAEGSGQDGEVRAGVPWPRPRFVDNGDGTVTDRLTGLSWLRDGNAFGTLSWDDALAACNALESGRHGLSDGSEPGDWRLPDVNELRSLEDYGQARPALPEDHLFVNVRQSLCWSSTTVASAPNLARFLFVGIGSCVWDHKGVVMGVWPVKGGLEPPG